MAERLLAHRFAAWAAILQEYEVSSGVRQAAQRAALDTVGVMVAGSAHPKVEALADSFSGVCGSCLTATGHRLEATAAATVNGMAAHVWDFDDNSYTGMVHGSAIILPAVLAVAEDVSATDDETLRAFIIGSEIAYTLGDIVQHGHFMRGWWATGSLALVGAVAGVCSLYGLSTDQTAHAIGMAAVSGGIERAIAGTDAKAYLCGHVAARSIALSRAARAGLTGPVDGFEQKNGFFALLNGGEADLSQADTLGRQWRLETPGLLFKINPVCSAAHAGVELMAKLLSETGKTAADIASARAEVPQLVRNSLVFDAPANAQEAQFSLPYCLACAALNGCVRLEDLHPDAIAKPEKAKLIGKVIVETAADLSSPPYSVDYPESTRLTLSFTDGSTKTGFCGEAYGMPNRPLSDADLRTKYNGCLSFAGRTASDELNPDALMAFVQQSFGFAAQKQEQHHNITHIRSIQ